MDFEFTPEHEELRQTVRRFLERESPEARVRALMETAAGYDERVWKRMAEELGLPGLVIPERHGGAGLGPVELAIAMEEMGRVLLCAPYLSTGVLSVYALLQVASEEERGRLLPEIASGALIAAVALPPQAGSGDGACRATREAGAWRLDGSAGFVIDGHVADVVLVVARTAEGLGLFRVEGGAAGLRRTALPTLDLTRKLSRLEFSAVSAAAVSAGDASAGLERALALTIAALGAEQLGGAQRCLEAATEYAKTRLQFGRPIGSYQAIKHKCADLLVEVEFARSAAYHAAFRARAGNDAEAAEAAHMAKAYCSEAYFHAAAESIQIHGGMGFTWEHPAHLYFKRAKASAVLFGDPIHHRRELARQIGI
ncbi:MAG: acyl-CoA/acyl-ACP dehydrogenase [Deltaproteobacteria bacterium]|nr:acyl-CoA/acyl-ACP dehydrogenase [Deltaproteobacteria bacterium]